MKTKPRFFVLLFNCQAGAQHAASLQARKEEQVGPKTCSSSSCCQRHPYQGTCLKTPTRIKRATTNAVRTAQVSRDSHLFPLFSAFVSTLTCFSSSSSHFWNLPAALVLLCANTPR